MAYTVAQAEVTVTPDARNFGRDLRAALTPEADRIGREVGTRIATQMREKLRGVNGGVDIDTAPASLKVDRFLAETKAKAEVAGRDAGRAMGRQMADGTGEGFGARGLLIGSAIAAGLMVGAPLIVAAGGVLIGGLAGVIVHSAPEVESAANEVGHAFTGAFKSAAADTVPAFAAALKEVAASASSMAAAVKPAFDSLQPAIQGVTRGVLGLVQSAIPGLVRAIQAGAPVFQGLQSMLTSVGQGLGNFFAIVSEHGAAMGATLSGLGDVLSRLFDTLGIVAAAGSELGAMVLPVLADALGIVNDVLQFLSPILPEVVLGLLALKTASMFSGLLTSLAASLESVGANAMVSIGALRGCEAAGLAAGTGFGAAAAGARGLQAAMGPIGWIMLAISVAVPLLNGALGHQQTAQEKVKDSADAMTSALQRSKGAIDDNVRATAAANAQSEGLFEYAAKWGVSTATIVDALTGNKVALEQVTEAAAKYKAAQDELRLAELARQDKDGGAAQKAAMYENEGKASAYAAEQIGVLTGKAAADAKTQTELKAAIDGTSDSAQLNAARLQGLANAASAGNTEINLLKTALDQLTGKAVSLGEAEVRVTDSVVAAKTALLNKTGALVDGTGAVNKHTEAGAALWSAMHRIGEQDNNLIAVMEQHGASTQEVTKRDGELRDQFIATARQMGLNASQAEGLATEILGIPERRNTEITLDTKAATEAAEALKARIDAIKSKTITVTIGQHVAGLNGGPGGTQTANARGNILNRFADGGFQPMQGGVAQVVAPNTWRIVGDRMQDDEAYIPINDSARSLSILAQTAGRMGYGLTPGGTSSSKTDARHYEFNISAAAEPAAIARSVREAQMDVEFLYG